MGHCHTYRLYFITFPPVIDSRRRARRQGQEDNEAGSSSTQPGTSLFEEKARPGKDRGKKARTGKLTTAELRELEAKKEQEAARSYARVKATWAQMLAGEEQADREWMHEAEMLVEQFQETRALYLTSRVWDLTLDYFVLFASRSTFQSAGFRGVFPHSGRRKQDAEANEESMASRLQLDIGRGTHYIYFLIKFLIILQAVKVFLAEAKARRAEY